jgi:Ca2+:H+ antiporter
MVESSDEPSLVERFRTRAHVSNSHTSGASRRPTITLSNSFESHNAGQPGPPSVNTIDHYVSNTTSDTVADDRSSAIPPPAPPPTSENRHGEASTTIEPQGKPNILVRFYLTSKDILLSSYINILLVFVPLGIGLNFTQVSPTVVFAINAVAIIPLAKLLTHATESVAVSMGDTIGALMNITFGNAVELIILSVLQKGP